MTWAPALVGRRHHLVGPFDLDGPRQPRRRGGVDDRVHPGHGLGQSLATGGRPPGHSVTAGGPAGAGAAGDP